MTTLDSMRPAEDLAADLGKSSAPGPTRGGQSVETLSTDMAEMAANVQEASSFLKRLANPDRLLLCCSLMEGEVSVSALEERLGLRQPGLSQQLAALRLAGLIAGRKQGKQVFYRLADPRVEAFIATLHRLFCGKASHGA